MIINSFVETVNVKFKHFIFSRDCLAFATEPVFSSLANILGNKENLPPNCDVNGYQLFDVEIKYGLMQVRSFFLCKFIALSF